MNQVELDSRAAGTRAHGGSRARHIAAAAAAAPADGGGARMLIVAAGGTL